MMPVIQIVIPLYAILMWLYPSHFRHEFEMEMRDVFAEMVTNSAKDGYHALMIVCLRELWDLPKTLIREYWSSFNQHDIIFKGDNIMQFLADIQSGYNDPARLEELYQTARKANRLTEFKADLHACYQSASDNLLYTAWHYRLQADEQESERSKVNWKLAIPLAVITGLIFWLMTFEELSMTFSDGTPYLFPLWGIVGGIFVIAFLTIARKFQPVGQTSSTSMNGQDVRSTNKRAIAVIVGLVVLSLYAMIFAVIPHDRNYRNLIIPHLPLLAWIGVGISILGLRSYAKESFAFVVKSIELFILAGIYLIGGGVFIGITNGLFSTINVRIPQKIGLLLVAGGFGLVIILAVASAYNPLVKTTEQNFQHGLSKLISTMMRLLLPLTLMVLVIFTIFIIQPKNFWIPFSDRDALIVYNGMLFAIILLLMGAIPMYANDLSFDMRKMLRIGIMAVATLTILVSLYAMSATLYRTYLGTITMNRMAVIGWNTINISILAVLIYKQFRYGQEKWIESAQYAFGMGMYGYITWTVFVIVCTPFLFGNGFAEGWQKSYQRAAVPIATPMSDGGDPSTEGEGEVEDSRPVVRPTATPAVLTELPEGCPPNCQGIDLTGAYLYDANFEFANLARANLRNADLRHANLHNANLRLADLRGTNLENADMRGATFHESQIDHNTQLGTNLILWQIVNQNAEQRYLSRAVNLVEADLHGVNLRGADLSHVSLQKANLSSADLSGVNLNHVSLHETYIDEKTQIDDKWLLVWQIVNEGKSGRDLQGMDLSQTDLSNANLSNADLRRAILTDTNLSHANLYGADLRGAILAGPDSYNNREHIANLTHANLAGVKIDDTTQIDDKWRLVWEVVNHGAVGRDLSGKDLRQADMHAVDFSGALLIGTNLSGANLKDANLSNADLNGA
ncbi:MAG: hypothetical protein B6242_14125 [Anaerolineaceae bacterium 4572_78]|nr:MAG: hypothetical protein B6242_14125 [Anaerolineaceae bacterium 4572_78]